MAETNLGRVQGSGIFRYPENMPEGDIVQSSKLEPTTICPLVGDCVLCPNGDLYKITGCGGGECQCTFVTSIKGRDGDKGEPGPVNVRLSLADTRNENKPPSWYMSTYGQNIVTEFKHCNVVGATGLLSGEYCNVTTIVPWPDDSGGLPVQFAVNSSTNGLGIYRTSTNDRTDWTAWLRLGAQGPPGPPGPRGTTADEVFEGHLVQGGIGRIFYFDKSLVGKANFKATFELPNSQKLFISDACTFVNMRKDTINLRFTLYDPDNNDDCHVFLELLLPQREISYTSATGSLKPELKSLYLS